MNEGKITQAEALQVQMDSAIEGTNRIYSLLGEKGLAQYEDYTASFPARVLIKQLDGLLGDSPLTDDQRHQLLDVYKTESLIMTSSLAGDFDIKSLSSPEEMEKRFQRQIIAAQRIEEKAAAFLSADQLATLRTMQLNNMNHQLAEARRTMGKPGE